MPVPADVSTPPIIFLAGPHGSGKSALGPRACRDLGLRFLDFSSPGAPSRAEAVGRSAHCQSDAEDRRQLDAAVVEKTAEVIALSVELQADAHVLKLARSSGVLLGLWAHPLEMQARSGRSEPLFTPCPTLPTQGGFAREGTRCPEFRKLDRACDHTLRLRGLTLDEAANKLTETVRAMLAGHAATTGASPAEREGLQGWMRTWRDEYAAKPKAAEILGDAMARYFLELKAKGTSPRTLSGIESDLEAAAILVFGYEDPKGKDVLECFAHVPCEAAFTRKFSDSASAVTRYRKNLEGFARFLSASGLVRELR